MVKFHVDVHIFFHDTVYLTEFGGNESFRKPKCDKIIISFGHDETIFNKDTYTSRCWSGYDGDQPLLPNIEGRGLMLSLIKYCEFGFGFGFRHVTDDQLRAINNRRCSSRNYVDHSVSIKVNGDIENKMFQYEDIFKSFVRGFEYVAKKYVYWSYEHLIIQLEDCINVMKGIYGNDFILKFMVDHSCGHD